MTARPSSPLGRRFTLPSAAAYLAMTTHELERLVRDRAITFHRRGPRARHYFYERELDAYLAADRVDPAGVRPTAAAAAARSRSVAQWLPAVRELA